MKYIDEMDLKGKRVLFRFDFNVPLDGNQNITDDTRIRSVLPTINYALDENAKIIIASHLGRPKGKVVEKMSLAPVAKRLSRLLGKNVTLTKDVIGPEVKKTVDAMKPGDIVMLENLRFDAREEKNDDEFSRELANLADVYIDDAFGNAHRSHASNVGITKFVTALRGRVPHEEGTDLLQPRPSRNRRDRLWPSSGAPRCRASSRPWRT